MPTEKHVTNFVVNKVPTKSIFEKMKNQGLINDDEIYLVERDDSDKTYVSYESQSLNSTQMSQARTNIGAAASSHNHKAGDITSGILPIDRGGTGSSESLRDAPNGAIIRKLSNDKNNQLYYTAIASGAFYSTSENAPAQFGTLPVAQGGTGATTADAARTNLGAFSTGGGTLTGNVTLSKGNPWIKLQDGDSAGYLQMYSSGTKMALGYGSSKSIVIDSDGCLILTSAMYGTTLPAAGKAGRIFFKKV